MEVASLNGGYVAAAFQRDGLRSNNLGDRERFFYAGEFGLKPQRSGPWEYNGAVALQYYDAFPVEVSPQAMLGYALTESWKTHAAVERTFRQPSFTELYYTSPTNIPNADLQLQQSDNYEWGLAYETSAFSAAGDLFYRHQTDTIDWVRNAGDTKFQAINAGKVDVRGFDLSAGMPIDLKIFNRARISYTRLDVDKQSSYDISKYVFDYLRDRAVTTFSADYGRWHYGLDGVYEYHIDLKERWIFNAQLRYDIADSSQVFLIGENIFDEDYEEYPFIDGEPLFVKAGVEIRF